MANVLHPLYEDESLNGYRHDSHLLADILLSKWFVSANVLVIGTNADVVLKRWDQDAKYREDFLQLSDCDSGTDPKIAMDSVLKRICNRSVLMQPAEKGPFHERAKGSMIVMSGVCSLSLGLHQPDLLRLLADWTAANSLNHFQLKESPEKDAFLELQLAPYHKSITTMLCVRSKVPFLQSLPKDIWKIIFKLVRDDFYTRLKYPELYNTQGP